MVKICDDLKDKSPSTIYGILKRLGVKTRKHFELNDEQTIKRRKFSLNDNYFTQIDTLEKAYWLGFLYADGYITTQTHNIGISLQIADKEHLNKFKNAINFTGEVKTYKQTSGYMRKENIEPLYCRLSFSSKIMKKHLIELGMLENKTLILKFPNSNQVPEYLLSHFIRGFMYGNGSITHAYMRNTSKKTYALKFCGTQEILNGIQDFFGTNIKLTTYKNRNAYNLDYGGNQQILRLLNIIYKDATKNIYLDRKYNKYKQIISELSS